MSATPKSLDSKASMQEQWDNSLLGGANYPWLESQYEQYLRDPNSVDEAWRDYFGNLPLVADENTREAVHSEIRAQFRQMANGRPPAGGTTPTAASASSAAELKQIYVTQLINAYRVRGHQLAKTDPLGGQSDAMVREVRLRENGLSEADLDTVFKTPSLEGIDQAPLKDVISHLEKCYCGSIGYEFMYIDYTPQKGLVAAAHRKRCISTVTQPGDAAMDSAACYCSREHGASSGFTLCWPEALFTGRWRKPYCHHERNSAPIGRCRCQGYGHWHGASWQAQCAGQHSGQEPGRSVL